MNSNRIKTILTVVLSALILLGLSIWAFARTPDKYSESEKRMLAQKPTFSKVNVIDGLYAEDFEKYSTEQFPMREAFRSVKYFVSHNILCQKDYNKIYIADGHISKIDYPMNEGMISHATSVFGSVYDGLISGTGANTYFCLVPDKNMYLAKQNGYLAFDYDSFFETAKSEMSFAKFIDVRELLSIDDYYKTDTHWKQESIYPAAEKIAETMGAKLDSFESFTVTTSPVSFAGVYANQLPTSTGLDSLKYLTNNTIENCNVTIYDYDDEGDLVEYGKGMYQDFESLKSDEQYQGFLYGPVPYITIENPNATTDKELIVFRDSFGSSISPLLSTGYAKVTVVDLRYLPSDSVGEYMDITNQDILFLCSTILLNSSMELN